MRSNTASRRRAYSGLRSVRYRSRQRGKECSQRLPATPGKSHLSHWHGCSPARLQRKWKASAASASGRCGALSAAGGYESADVDMPCVVTSPISSPSADRRRKTISRSVPGAQVQFASYAVLISAQGNWRQAIAYNLTVVCDLCN